MHASILSLSKRKRITCDYCDPKELVLTSLEDAAHSEMGKPKPNSLRSSTFFIHYIFEQKIIDDRLRILSFSIFSHPSDNQVMSYLSHSLHL